MKHPFENAAHTQALFAEMPFSYGDRLAALSQNSYYPGPDIVPASPSLVSSLTSMSLSSTSALTKHKNDSVKSFFPASPPPPILLHALSRPEAWDVAWPVVAAFSVKSNNPFARYCMACHRSVPAGEFCSNFVSQAVVWSCPHQEKGIVCSKCDEQLLMDISLGRQKCWEPGCKGDLSVKMDVVEEVMGNTSDAFKRYRDMVVMECAVCCESFPSWTSGVTKECKHKRNICKGCLEQMIAVAVNKGGWDGLKCPEDKCKLKLSFEDVRVAASKDVFMRYDELVSLRSFKRMQNYQACNRPNQACKAGQIHEPGDDDPKMTCIACGYVSCFSCSAPWHEGQTCLQAHDLLAKDPETEEYKRKYCKRCPGVGCGLFTKKDGACHEMQCPNNSCGVLWCWECKLIMNTSADYSSRALKQHTSACTAPVVVAKKARAGYKSVPKPVGNGGGKYRVGWDKDEGFIGTGQEY